MYLFQLPRRVSGVASACIQIWNSRSCHFFFAFWAPQIIDENIVSREDLNPPNAHLKSKTHKIQDSIQKLQVYYYFLILQLSCCIYITCLSAFSELFMVGEILQSLLSELKDECLYICLDEKHLMGPWWLLSMFLSNVAVLLISSSWSSVNQLFLRLVVRVAECCSSVTTEQDLNCYGCNYDMKRSKQAAT